MLRHVSTTSLNNNNYYSEHAVAQTFRNRRKSEGEKLHDAKQIKVLSCAMVVRGGIRRRRNNRAMGFSSSSVRVKPCLITWSRCKVPVPSGELDGRIHKQYAKDAHRPEICRQTHLTMSYSIKDNFVRMPFIILKDLAHSCSKCVHMSIISLPDLTCYRVAFIV